MRESGKIIFLFQPNMHKKRAEADQDMPIEDDAEEVSLVEKVLNIK